MTKTVTAHLKGNLRLLHSENVSRRTLQVWPYRKSLTKRMGCSIVTHERRVNVLKEKQYLGGCREVELICDTDQFFGRRSGQQ